MIEPRKYSWAWVTSSRLLSQKPCLLLYAYVKASGSGSDTALYDGENTSGVIIADISPSAAGQFKFKPTAPVYCDRGLYLNVGTGVSGVFVQFLEVTEAGG